MKRCPKCEFIYEDDQSLCDMDGVLLVLDSRTLPHLNALQTVPPPKTTPKRNRAVPAFATLTLALVLGMVYYVSTERKPTYDADIPPQPIAVSTLNPVPEVKPAAETPKPEPAKPAVATAAAVPVKKAPAKPAPIPAKPKAEEKKDDSKVGNFLKKTGRILKKPFKL
jgi:hypothetical protein